MSLFQLALIIFYVVVAPFLVMWWIFKGVRAMFRHHTGEHPPD